MGQAEGAPRSDEARQHEGGRACFGERRQMGLKFSYVLGPQWRPVLGTLHALGGPWRCQTEVSVWTLGGGLSGPVSGEKWEALLLITYSPRKGGKSKGQFSLKKKPKEMKFAQ